MGLISWIRSLFAATPPPQWPRIYCHADEVGKWGVWGYRHGYHRAEPCPYGELLAGTPVGDRRALRPGDQAVHVDIEGGWTRYRRLTVGEGGAPVLGEYLERRR